MRTFSSGPFVRTTFRIKTPEHIDHVFWSPISRPTRVGEPGYFRSWVYLPVPTFFRSYPVGVRTLGPVPEIPYQISPWPLCHPSTSRLPDLLAIPLCYIYRSSPPPMTSRGYWDTFVDCTPIISGLRFFSSDSTLYIQHPPNPTPSLWSLIVVKFLSPYPQLVLLTLPR